MIVRAVPGLAPAEAARRAAGGNDPAWLSSPGLTSVPNGGDAGADARIQVDVVAADPAHTVRAGSVEDLERAWQEARARWGGGGAAAAGVPIAAGWLSYDLARRWAPAAPQGQDWPALDWPALEFRFYDAVWVQEVGAGEAHILACDGPAADRLAARMAHPAPELPPPTVGPLTSEPEDARARHAAAVVRIQEYLRAGDAYQVNLARRLTAPVGPGDPVWLAGALRARTPAPHAIWLGGRSTAGGEIDRIVVGNSPERFLHVAPDGRVETRPIKGTRARGVDARADAAASAALAASPKDRAEHVMIVDLERNDLGRVCQLGTVAVADLMRVLKLPTVFHLVTTVHGRLRPRVGLAELLRATFPGGSITGAPKRRAMEIIDELEPAPRGLYTGATGWLGAAGDLDLAIAIRTAVVSAGRLSLSIGGGIVVDSGADAEWDETEVKARAFLDLSGSHR